MDHAELRSVIEGAWETRDTLTVDTVGPVRNSIEQVLNLLDEGVVRVAEPDGVADAVTGAKKWIVHDWLKKAVLLSFRINPMRPIPGGPGLDSVWFDKVSSKFEGWSAGRFERAGFRAVPGAIVRHSAYIAPDAVLMPSFVNLGAYVGSATMVDTWATIGSCAQIGAQCHISGGAGIGGVLEPVQAAPVIIEDGVFIGARSEVAEGVIVEEGAVLSMGVYLSASTRIIDRETGEVFRGRVPAYAVVVPGTMPGPEGTPGLYCAVIVKRVDAQTRAKTAINDLLRA